MTTVNNKTKKSGLGRGLSALLQNADTDITLSSEYRSHGNSSIQFVEISQIEANPFQPRTEFEQKALEELSESIKIHGLIQPITVRPPRRMIFPPALHCFACALMKLIHLTGAIDK